MSLQLLEEAKYCYVYGQYVATAMLAAAFIERLIAAEFYASGRDDLERASIARLLDEAKAAGWLTGHEFSRLDRVRTLRNPLAHFRRPLADDTLLRRSIGEDREPHLILEADAREILLAALGVLAKVGVSPARDSRGPRPG